MVQLIGTENMTVSLSNPWMHVGAAMAVPLYILISSALRRLKKWKGESESNSVFSVPGLWKLRWHVIIACMSLGLVMVLVNGTHRLFVGVECNETALILNYPWPREDVLLGWNEVSGVDMASMEFGIWHNKRYRLQVSSGQSVYFSQWIADPKDLKRALEIMQGHVAKK